MDDTDSATFVLFDRDAAMLFNKSCAEVLRSRDTVSILHNLYIIILYIHLSINHIELLTKNIYVHIFFEFLEGCTHCSSC
jgi:hypothetical protein